MEFVDYYVRTVYATKDVKPAGSRGKRRPSKAA